MTFADINPFTDIKSVIKAVVLVAVVLFILKVTGLKSYVS